MSTCVTVFHCITRQKGCPLHYTLDYIIYKRKKFIESFKQEEQTDLKLKVVPGFGFGKSLGTIGFVFSAGVPIFVGFKPNPPSDGLGGGCDGATQTDLQFAYNEFRKK